MKKFIYRAITKDGKSITGEVEGLDKGQAAKLLRGKGLIVVNIKPKSSGPFGFIANFRNRIKSSEISNFTRQFATMINAGLPVTESLSILRLQSSKSLQPIVGQVLADIEDGSSLSVSMSRFPSVFGSTYIALIKAGEAGGVLDKVLLRLADNMEKDEEFKGKVKGALIYPAIIVGGLVIVSFIMMVFVIPRLTSLYTEFNAELPLPTKLLIGISSLATRFWPLTVAAVGAGAWFFQRYRNTKAGKHQLDMLYFKIPIIGELQKQIVLTELTRTLSLMVGAGVPILEGLSVTAGVVSNSVISDALKDTITQIEKGFPIAYSFAKHPEAFPFILSQMIAIGEETGKMEDVLNKISHIFEVNSEQQVKALTAAIEPAVMIVLGLGVAFLVIAVILPIYNLTSSF